MRSSALVSNRDQSIVDYNNTITYLSDFLPQRIQRHCDKNPEKGGLTTVDFLICSTKLCRKSNPTRSRVDDSRLLFPSLATLKDLGKGTRGCSWSIKVDQVPRVQLGLRRLGALILPIVISVRSTVQMSRRNEIVQIVQMELSATPPRVYRPVLFPNLEISLTGPSNCGPRYNGQCVFQFDTAKAMTVDSGDRSIY